MKKSSTARKPAALTSMTFAALLDLREELETLINERVRSEQLELEKRLDALKRLAGRVSEVRDVQARTTSLRGRKLPPRFRNPKNPKQTWAGRGLRPRWLVDAIKGGRKLQDFAVD